MVIAVDTAEKRQSMMHFGSYIEESMVIPDANISQRNRQSFIWGYAGVLFTTPFNINIHDIQKIVSPITLGGRLLLRNPATTHQPKLHKVIRKGGPVNL